MRLLEPERPGFTEDTPVQLARERRIYFAVMLLTIAMGLLFSV